MLRSLRVCSSASGMYCGSAGDAYVNLQLIDALREKEIRQIPKLPGGNIIIDGNKLLQQLGVVRNELNRQKQDEAEDDQPPAKQ